MIADLLEGALVQQGYDVCGIGRTVSEAIDLGDQHMPDFAVIDIRLADGGLGTAVASHLRKSANIGILYSTGNRHSVALTTADGQAVVTKPYRMKDIGPALRVIEQIVNLRGIIVAVPARVRVAFARPELAGPPAYADCNLGGRDAAPMAVLAVERRRHVGYRQNGNNSTVTAPLLVVPVGARGAKSSQSPALRLLNGPASRMMSRPRECACELDRSIY